MTQLRRHTVAAFPKLRAIVAIATLAACSQQAEISIIPLPTNDTLGVTLSDVSGVAYTGSGNAEIIEVASPTPLITLTLTASASPDWIGATASLTPDELRRLAMGETVTPAARGFVNYPHASGDDPTTTRDVRSIHMSIANATASLTMMLGTQEVSGSPNPDALPSATMEIRGQFPIGCSPRDAGGNSLNDPRWESPFCAREKAAAGLDLWIESQI